MSGGRNHTLEKGVREDLTEKEEAGDVSSEGFWENSRGRGTIRTKTPKQ